MRNDCVLFRTCRMLHIEDGSRSTRGAERPKPHFSSPDDDRYCMGFRTLVRQRESLKPRDRRSSLIPGLQLTLAPLASCERSGAC